MAEKPQRVSINEHEKWGLLKDPDSHTAAFGVRLIDNRRRQFGYFSDRATEIGDPAVLSKVKKWLCSNKIQKKIKDNTHFVWDADACEWRDVFNIGGNIEVELVVRCAGEYCHVAAYADSVPPLRIDLTPMGSGDDTKWVMEIDGFVYPECPKISAKTKNKARSMLVDYLLNELSGKDDIIE